ncbi:MAG TPA: hypothetical protein VKR55_01485 [Bradyrhizobium sp.]|uniref:hypothetical protein n=1 Tax=Bradyrhizobium sp. TaxID=376 RepID=UPI002C22E4B3|nr:hypothetical protein [Bradyrhizobium sp.]HLZ00803.1 hypothetical protein [Bradyrhizobium sp.]
MREKIAIAALALSLVSSQAVAGEHRGGDAALGALSGAVVLGPIGAVAGAVVGYTAGPAIAHSWGFRGSRPAPRRVRASREMSQSPDMRPAVQAGPSAAAPSPAAAPAPQAVSTVRPSQGLPPVQTLE